MPWTKADVDRHKKDLTDKQKETWVEVANSALKRCVGKGGSQEECEGSAIRQANSVVGQQKESGMDYKAYTMSTNNVLIPINAIDVDGDPVPVAELVAAYEEQRGQGQGQGGERQGDGGAGVCVCPECEREFPHERGTPCDQRKCPDCGVALTGKSSTEESADLEEAVWTTAFVNDLPDSSFALIEPGGKKDEEGKTVPRSLRHLPYKDSGGKVDVPHLRNALARLPQMKGVSSELKARAMRTLQAAAKKHLKTHQEEMEQVDIGKVRGLLQEALAMLDAPIELKEVELAESAAGHAVGLEETGKVADGPRAPLMMEVALIKPGFGNKKDNHYYPADVLKRDIHVFEGVKMYTTDHRQDEKNVRTEVAVIKTCPSRFLDNGTPIALAAVHDGDFAEQARNRAELGTLESLECSILGGGRVKKGRMDGQDANIVEAITKGQSVDWVTKGGAGGHAHGLAENDAGGVNMDQEKIKELLSESELPQESQERLAGAEYEDEGAVKEAILQEKARLEAPQQLAEAEVAKMLSETNLPSVAKKRLAKGEYEDESALREVILAETEYVKTLTGSGQPFAQGGRALQEEIKPLSERLDAIDQRYGLQAQRQEA